ncbi:MAG: Smr/MutS family protein [Patescibacteria group bacterium]
MKENDMKFFAASISPTLPTIDLHNFGSVSDALEKLGKGLSDFVQKEQYCRVVHGIGEGVLAVAVHESLNKNSLVAEWREEENGGSCIVIF